MFINGVYATCFSVRLPGDCLDEDLLGSVSFLPGLSGVCLCPYSCVCVPTLEVFFDPRRKTSYDRL